MTWGFSEPFGFRQTQTRWKDLEFYVHDSWKVKPRLTIDIGARWSLLFNYYSNDDTQTSFNPALYNPALGGDPCNGLTMVPGTNPCSAAGFQGGVEGPNRSLQDEKYDAIAPRLGFAYDVSGATARPRSAAASGSSTSASGSRVASRSRTTRPSARSRPASASSTRTPSLATAASA